MSSVGQIPGSALFPLTRGECKIGHLAEIKKTLVDTSQSSSTGCKPAIEQVYEMESLPKFRVDLVTYPQAEAGGQKRVVLRDAVSQRYYQLSEYEYNLLKMLDGSTSIEEAIEKLKQAGHYYSLSDAKQIAMKASQFGLLLGTGYGVAKRQVEQKETMRKAAKVKFLSSVYFLFIPVWNPDRFLERTLWLFKYVANKRVALLFALAAPGALYLIVSGIPRIRLEYLFFFNFENLLFLWFTIALTKLIHEFSHAYTAKSFGLYVPEMGVAFLIFFPCLYCNTTDAWQLADRKQRAAIAAAGIAAETALAIIATYVWYFTRPGMVNSLAFYLMAVSFTSTLLFNGNPLLKFDGYFLLIDTLGIPNLYTNSFRHLKYLFMNRVMGVSRILSPARNSGQSALFSVYGTCAFLYRISLYTGLAVGVYYRFDKVLGILLGLLAISVFMVRPVVRGIATLYKTRRELKPRYSGLAAFFIILAVVAVPLCIPWSPRSVYPCFVGSQKTQKLTVPLHTIVRGVFIREGDTVKKGDALFSLDTSLLELKLRQAVIQAQTIEKEIQMLLLEEKLAWQAESKEVELRQAHDEIDHLKDQLRLAQTNVTAPFDGVVTSLEPTFQEGFQPGEGAVVGELKSLRECVVHALVPDTDIHSIHEGEDVEIWLPVGVGRLIRKQVDSIKSHSETDMENSPFSSRFGGEVATEVRGEKQQDVPLEALYDCSVNIANVDGDVLLGMTGRMAVYLPRKSILIRFYEKTMRAFNRESFL
jgi:putative peptide zinc metalloprotease protein